MSITEQRVRVDGENLMQFVFRAVGEVGATLNGALVVMGDKRRVAETPFNLVFEARR